MRSARTTALVCVHPGESVTRPGHGRHQSGELGVHSHLGLTTCSVLTGKSIRLLLTGLLVFDPLSAFHGPAAREKFKGTQARTKNTPGWSVSAVSEERWLTFPKFNSHSLSLRLHKEYTLYLQHRTPRVWCHTLEKPHQILSAVKNKEKKYKKTPNSSGRAPCVWVPPTLSV